MDIAQKILRIATLVSAGLAALIFPIMLFGLQGFGTFNLEVALILLSFYLTHPASIVLIFLASFGKIAPGRSTHIATGVITFNALLLIAMAILVHAEVFKGDSFLPLVLAIPAILFLLNRKLTIWRTIIKASNTDS